jgi:dihydroorotate dehydrogenase
MLVQIKPAKLQLMIIAAQVGHLARYADYITLNISSPNTPGLRNLQTKAHLADLLAAGRAGLDEAAGDGEVSAKPIFLKIAPDLHHDDLVAIVESCVEAGVSGIIATNTTLARPDDLDGVHAGESGGLSGAPLFEAATAILADVARLSDRRLGLDWGWRCCEWLASLYQNSGWR